MNPKRDVESAARDFAREDENFERWREAVGFGRSFPRLRALRHPCPDGPSGGPAPAFGEAQRAAGEPPHEDARRHFASAVHLKETEEISQSLGSAAKVILTAPGHGATTLARWLFDQASAQAIIRRAIPVWVSLEDLLKESQYAHLVQRSYDRILAMHPRIDQRQPTTAALSADEQENERDRLREQADDEAEKIFRPITPGTVTGHVQEAVRRGLVESLVTKEWERVLAKPVYREIIGAPTIGKEDLQNRRLALQLILANPDSAKREHLLREAAPILATDDFVELAAEIHRASGIRISLFLDLSPSPAGRCYLDHEVGEYLTRPYLNVLRHFTKTLKNIEQAGAMGPQPTLPALLDKTLFLSSTGWQAFQAHFADQDVDEMAFSPYRSIDLFAMLAHHYPPHDQDWGRRVEVLAAVLDSNHLKLTDRVALSSETAILEHHIRARLGVMGDQVPYHLFWQVESRKTPPALDARTLFKALSEMDDSEIRDALDQLYDLVAARGPEEGSGQ